MKFQRLIIFSLLITITSLKAATAGTTAPTTPAASGPALSAPSPVNIREDVTSEKDLATITCLDNSDGVAPGTRCLSCNIDYVTPTFDGFNVWKKNGDLDFHLYYFQFLPNHKLNYTAVSSYTVGIVCHGNDLVTATWMIEVDVQLNQPPVFSVYPTGAVPQSASNTAGNIPIYTPTVTDAENDTVTFTWEIIPPTNLFTVNPITGVVSTLRDLRAATINSFVIKMHATDGRRTTGPFTLTLTLTDLNSAPSCSNVPATHGIREDAPNGQVILTITCSDPDQPGVLLTPNMTVDPFEEAWKFDFNGRILKLTSTPSATSLLDAESVQFYRICFQLTDGYLEAGNLCVSITVINVNESPRCNSNGYPCRLDETSASSPSSHCDLTNFGFIDPENDQITSVTIVPSAFSNIFSWETLRSRLTLSSLYDADDRSKLTSFTIELLAIDSGNASTTCTVMVTVADVNDNDPQINGQLIHIVAPDSPQVPSILGSLIVTDNDLLPPNNHVTLQLKSMFPGIGSSYVRLDGTDLRYIRRADASIIGETLLMEIEARDSGRPPRSSSVTVYITVQAEPPTTQPTVITTQSTAAGDTTTQAGQGGGASGGTDPGLLSSDVGVVLVAAVVAIAAVLVLTGGFFLFRYLTTGSCPVQVSSGQSSTSVSHSKYGNSSTRVSPYNTEQHNTSHYYGEQRYPNY